MKKKNKFHKKQQLVFIELLADLLNSGFTFQESFNFMKKSQIIPGCLIDLITDQLGKGRSFPEGIRLVGFSEMSCMQIALAQEHGNMVQTLKKMTAQMRMIKKQQENFYKILSYPLILVSFLIIVIVGLRQFVLPQLIQNGNIESSSYGIRVIQASPYYLGIFLLISISLLSVGLFYTKQISALKQATILSKIPTIKHFFKQYYSASFAAEWGKLFYQGLEMKTVVELMEKNSHYPLMIEIAQFIKKQAASGKKLDEQLANFSFFLPELSTIIRQGEIKGNLGKELLIYSDMCWQRFFEKIEKRIQLVQPFLFLLIALLVVGVYAALLLPIYDGMEGYL